MGKAIYQPKGKAKEYNDWAVNFYLGCKGNCSYCYLKKGNLARLWSVEPKLKKAFKDEDDAIRIFRKELRKNLFELSNSGLFFNFSSDPFLPETFFLTMRSISICIAHNIPIILLTKQTWWLEHKSLIDLLKAGIVYVGFTLTGRDDLEPGCAKNKDRIKAMRELQLHRIRTWASIEPVIDTELSYNMIYKSFPFCDHFKIGLESGRKYETIDIQELYYKAVGIAGTYQKTLYFKDSFVNQANLSRNKMPEFCVSSDYKIWKH